MLLTLSTRSLANRVKPTKKGKSSLSMLDVPDYAIRQLKLRGLNVPAEMLAGWSLNDIDRFRDRADKAGCPCLVLVDSAPLPFGCPSDQGQEDAAERVRRLAAAAHRLGCNAISVAVDAKGSDEVLERVAAHIKEIMPDVERLELNVLIAPPPGSFESPRSSANTGSASPGSLTQDPDRLVELIKRIGGFRIGSLPSFGHAAETGDAIGTLRKLAPYAGAIHATIDSFTKGGAHRGYDLAECVAAIRSVGFVNTLAIEYVGSGDSEEAIEQAREILQQAIEAE